MQHSTKVLTQYKIAADYFYGLYYFSRVEQFDAEKFEFFLYKVTGNVVRFVSFNMGPYGML